MKILNLITSIFNGKPKTQRKRDDLKFPILTNKEFVLLRAERNTGIILDVDIKYALHDKSAAFTKFNNFCNTVDEKD